MRPLFIWLLLAILGTWLGISRLDFDVDILALMPGQVREVEGLKQLRGHFEARNDLLVAVNSEAEPAEGPARRLLNHLERLPEVGSARLLGDTRDLGGMGAVIAWALQNAPTDRLGPLIERLRSENLSAHLDGVIERLANSPDPAEVQRWSYDPIGLIDVLGEDTLSGALDADTGAFATEGKIRVIRVQPSTAISHYKPAMAWIGQIQQAMDAWKASEPESAGKTSIGLTGELAFMAEAGGGMQRDLSGTIGISMLFIGALFWLLYRRVLPLLWLTLALGIVLGVTIGIGSLVLGSINAMNLGFAAIVLGLVVDYGVLIYQESACRKDAGVLRAHVLRSILGAAVSTGAVFLLLGFSQFPGLRQLGVLVAIGVGVGCAVMLTMFPSLAVRHPPVLKPVATAPVARQSNRLLILLAPTLTILILISLVLGIKGMPSFDGSSAPLRPKNSEAMRALELIEGPAADEATSSQPLLVVGDSIEAVRDTIEEIRTVPGVRVWLPVVFLPDKDVQLANRPLITELSSASGKVKAALDSAGFDASAAGLFEAVAAACGESLGKSWPMEISQSAAAETLGQFISYQDGRWALLGWMRRSADGAAAGQISMLLDATVHDQSGWYLPSWGALGSALGKVARQDALTRMLPFSLLLLLVLLAVLRSVKAAALAIAGLAFAFAGQFALMTLLGQSWNLASIAAIPLLIGAAEDYGIHMLLALQQTGGDAHRVRRTTGRAVLFCGISSCIAFSSLTFAGNGGVASLGAACAVGLGMMMVVAIALLPAWWQALHPSAPEPPKNGDQQLGSS